MAEHRILIVEDSPTMRKLLVFALKRLKGVHIIEASDGMDGLRRYIRALHTVRLVGIVHVRRHDVAFACHLSAHLFPVAA